MLPLDEAPFAIDANKRTIANPKITVMQKDQNAEVVMFTIDRYFDYKDLDTAYIWVQWTLPDGKEGASAVEMKDLSIPGKIRFGWPLDDEITSQDGQVKFSVRFWNVDKIDGKDVVVYSFNTQTSTLTVTKSLQPELNSQLDVNSPIADGFFKKAILKSQYHGENIALPLQPYFEDPGKNLPKEASLVENQLTLKAQAIAPDTGTLHYEWYYNPAEDKEIDGYKFISGNFYPYEDVKEDEVVVTPGFKRYGGKVEEVYEKIGELAPGNAYIPVGNTAERIPLSSEETYYVGDSHKVYGGEISGVLYEKYTTYTVPFGVTDDEDDIDPSAQKVTGQYQVFAKNTIGTNDSNLVGSHICQLLSPDQPEFVKNNAGVVTGDLPERMFVSDLRDGKLAVNVTADNKQGIERNFTWFRRSINENSENADEIFENATNEMVIDTPGWYDMKLESTLNRETKTLTSRKCKITADPLVPEPYTTEFGDSPAYMSVFYGDNAENQEKDKDKGIPKYDLTKEVTSAILDVDVKVNLSGDYAGFDESLFSEQLIYTWQIQKLDESFRDLTEADMGEDGFVIGGLNTPALEVKRTTTSSVIIDNYRCIVTNLVGNKSATCEFTKALTFMVE